VRFWLAPYSATSLGGWMWGPGGGLGVAGVPFGEGEEVAVSGCTAIAERRHLLLLKSVLIEADGAAVFVGDTLLLLDDSLGNFDLNLTYLLVPAQKGMAMEWLHGSRIFCSPYR